MWALEYCKCVTGYQTYRCDISKHLSLKSFLDMSTVSLFLLHYVFPVRVWHNKASLQHRQLSWRSLNRERERKKRVRVTHHHDWTHDRGGWGPPSPVTCQANGGRVGGPDCAHSSHPSQGKALNFLTSASALCGFFASVFESVAPTNQQHEMACSRNNVVLISKKKERRKRCERESWRCSTNKSG